MKKLHNVHVMLHFHWPAVSFRHSLPALFTLFVWLYFVRHVDMLGYNTGPEHLNQVSQVRPCLVYILKKIQLGFVWIDTFWFQFPQIPKRSLTAGVFMLVLRTSNVNQDSWHFHIIKATPTQKDIPSSCVQRFYTRQTKTKPDVFYLYDLYHT